MGNRRQRWHLERSRALVSHLRTRGIEKREFIDALVSEAGEAERSKRVSLSRAWGGLRPLFFDGKPDQPSEVELLHRAWPGATYYFFHPLWTLLTPVLRSGEKTRQALAPAPDWVLQRLQDDASKAKGRRRSALNAALEAVVKRNEALKVAQRLRTSRSTSERTLDIGLIHAAVLQLRKPQRDVLLEPSVVDVKNVPGLHVPWVRRSQSLERDLQALTGAEVIDQLAILLALALEAALTGRERSFLKILDLVKGMKRPVARDATLAQIGKSVLRGMRLSVRRFVPLETHLISAQFRALPESWLDQAAQWRLELEE